MCICIWIHLSMTETCSIIFDTFPKSEFCFFQSLFGTNSWSNSVFLWAIFCILSHLVTYFPLFPVTSPRIPFSHFLSSSNYRLVQPVLKHQVKIFQGKPLPVYTRLISFPILSWSSRLMYCIYHIHSHHHLQNCSLNWQQWGTEVFFPLPSSYRRGKKREFQNSLCYFLSLCKFNDGCPFPSRT